MKTKISTKALCRAAIIAAMYVVLTMIFGALAYGPFQIRPGEALCVLPLFYAESVPGLFVGCLLANVISGYGVYDIFLGSLATLFASLLTYLVGRIIRNKPLKVIVGGLFPVLLNSFVVPAIWLLAGMGDVVYMLSVAEMLLTESVWVYGLGTALFVALVRVIPKAKALQPIDRAPRRARTAQSAQRAQDIQCAQTVQNEDEQRAQDIQSAQAVQNEDAQSAQDIQSAQAVQSMRSNPNPESPDFVPNEGGGARDVSHEVGSIKEESREDLS